MPTTSLLNSLALLLLLLGSVNAAPSDSQSLKSYPVTGTIISISSIEKSLVIRHEAITNLMPAMTMPFNVKSPALLDGLSAGDRISFRLNLTDSESWVDSIVKTGRSAQPVKLATASPPAQNHHPLRDFKFTNELGQAVSLNDFRGQALAITFFYSRCPIPEYCPRLSKNFQEASEKLAAMPAAPANWHFLSFSFDPDFDTPAMLKAYGQSYQYDPAHWSFLTGPKEIINELVRQSGVTYEAEGGIFNHNFRTLIVGADGRLQTEFITSGDLSGDIVAAILKAAAVTNTPDLQIKN
jgi:protein SCO1/2